MIYYMSMSIYCVLPKNSIALNAGILKENNNNASDHVKHFLFFFYFSALHIYLPIRQFFYDIIHPEYSPVCDVYALMFLVDVVNFIIIIFGYWAFGVSAALHTILFSHLNVILILIEVIQF